MSLKLTKLNEPKEFYILDVIFLFLTVFGVFILLISFSMASFLSSLIAVALLCLLGADHGKG